MFKNEPLTDFTVPEFRQQLKDALSGLNTHITQGALKAGSIINGEVLFKGEEYRRPDPSRTSVNVGITFFADQTLVDQALSSLKSGVVAWANTSPSERAKIISKAADLMRARKHELSARIIREAGKPWREADADVAEAIDFCAYYAEEMVRLGTPQKTSNVPGEENIYFYQPRGIAVVISPWNFPLAIACGMVVAALVTGNATILKPSEQTSLIAFEFAKILLEAGVPKNVFAFLPGRGEIIGQALVDKPEVDMICFTGSKAVGLEIINRASKVQPKQKNIKRVIAELGGKNAIIIDEDADLDEAIKGVISSAFGFVGQKCSACSRVIAVGDAYETFLGRFASATSDLISGEASEPSTLIGPVIDQESQARIVDTISKAEKDHKLLYKAEKKEGGYYVPLAVFRDVSPQSALWCQEIFGPVIACMKAKDFQEALQLANDCEYALTGGLFSRSPANIETAKREFKVGNLYINRGCTGALVCRQPFGGFRMSGIGSKAGGPDYLLQFMEPRVITENQMRRGFAPEN